ncbi:DUF3012 domain-containing protein [Methylonatrum kenyense]|uniref:DUF3012 domain-containing protein n=1 Tax=Methylonatrum kenyense TaxID=455253 RepID=UPI0020C096DD|nr:DUF3012 domain-containing protein [Methylonatrum kenyense]MCK8514814.1 DUF3012 domain-containing protein [Methylonatrum kenyense]
MDTFFSRACILLLGLLLMACGSDQPDAAEPETAAEASVTVDAGTVTDQLLLFMDQQINTFEKIIDAVDGVDSQAAANDVAARFRDEFTPEFIDIYETFFDWLETHLLGMDEAQQIELEASFEQAALDGRLGPVIETESRFERTLMRGEQQMAMLSARDPQLMVPIEQAMMELGQQLEPLMLDERMLALERMMDGGPPSGAPPVGSPAWCQQMANTPQAQWTPNDGFAFASHCIGG